MVSITVRVVLILFAIILPLLIFNVFAFPFVTRPSCGLLMQKQRSLHVLFQIDGTDNYGTFQNNINKDGMANQPSKTDLYSTDELFGLLNIHTTLKDSTVDFLSSTSDIVNDTAVLKESSSLSLQDVIEQAVDDITKTALTEVQTPWDSELSDGDAQQWKSLKFQSTLGMSDFAQRIPQIRAIVSDVDGTLLGTDHTLHPITEQSIVNAVEASFSPLHPLQLFFPATGKTRIGAFNSLGSKMKALLQQSPGVYVQGLYCIDALGNVVFEKKLSRIAVEQVESLVASNHVQHNISLLAYDGDAIYSNAVLSYERHVQDVSMKWGEPRPVQLENTFASYEPSFHKILLMGDDSETMSNVIRPQLEELASSLNCAVTQAIPTMLELLPGGCSKAVGVQKLCESFGIDLATQVCAIGDAENDYDMIRIASIGIAVGNAVPTIKNVADIVMDDTSSNGAAGQAIELFGLGNIFDLSE
jgi:Cof subfamily protein (haloacid dehalogenase superfamily)